MSSRETQRQAGAPKQGRKGERAGFKPGQLRWLVFLSMLALSASAGVVYTFAIYPPAAFYPPLAEWSPWDDLLAVVPLDRIIPAVEGAHVQAAQTTRPTPIPTWIAVETAPRPNATATYTAIPIKAAELRQTTAPNTPTPIPTLTPILRYWRIPIGESVEGRPIEVYRFGEGEVERMIVSGIHGGGEWNTIALANQLIDHIKGNQELLPVNTTLYILPALNPDGEARAHGPDGRVNANGVDLNRNWDAGWQAHWPRFGCWDRRLTTSGPYPASEPETQALMNFLLTRQVDVLISYHSAALGIFPSGSPPDPGSVRFAQAIAEITPYRYPPVRTGCVFSGTLVDWALAQGAIGVDLELRNHLETDFEINLEVLSLLLNWQP